MSKFNHFLLKVEARDIEGFKLYGQIVLTIDECEEFWDRVKILKTDNFYPLHINISNDKSYRIHGDSHLKEIIRTDPITDEEASIIEKFLLTDNYAFNFYRKILYATRPIYRYISGATGVTSHTNTPFTVTASNNSDTLRAYVGYNGDVTIDIPDV